VRLLKEICSRQNVGFVNVVQYDGEKGLPFAERSFDVVLVDAPCSGTGTIRRNPEIRYLISEQDVLELAAKQRVLLLEASKLVKPGGRFIYSTCSLESEENELAARWFGETGREFEAFAPDNSGMLTDAEGFLSTNPATSGADGFFAAVFRRVVAD
jgi:16S rRNA (cytosine967-C5)-methyltransferase